MVFLYTTWKCINRMSNIQQNIEEYYKEKKKKRPVTAGADVVFGLDGFAVTGGSLGFKIESLSWFRPVILSAVYINEWVNTLNVLNIISS